MNKNQKLIGVCGTSLFEQNSIHFLSALKDVCLKTGYTTVAFSASIDSSTDSDCALGELKLLDLCQYVDLDCIIILTETLKSQILIQKLVDIGKKKNIPVFSVDGIVDGCYNMSLNYRQGFRDMVRHVIIDHGVSTVNMLAGMRENSFSQERVQIFKEVLEECGIPFEEERLAYGDFWDRPTRIALNQFLNSDLPMPEAIICANDEMAITTCSVLSDRGYRIPEDIIVTGFDGTQSSRYNFPSITTCDPDYFEASEFVIKKTDEVKQTGRVVPCDHLINFNILKSQSCGCEPGTLHNHSKAFASLYRENGDSAWHNIAMNTLVTNLLDKQNIEDIAELLPETVHLWSEHFRFACIKSELMKPHLSLENCRDATGSFTKMTSILCAKNQIFDETYKEFNVNEFVPNFSQLIDRPGTTLVVRLLNYKQQVYGYTVDEFTELNHSKLTRCNEFAMFLNHSINTVLHNFELNQLNRNLEKAYSDIAALSVIDPMTGVYNRRGFFKMFKSLLAEKNETNKYICFVYVDLDGLKYINDNFGHKEGDFAIKSVALSLHGIQTGNLLCSRFGGDEFVCAFLSDSPDKYDELTIKQQIKSVLCETPGLADKPYNVDFSIGVYNQIIDDTLNLEQIILSADTKMYNNKMSKRK